MDLALIAYKSWHAVKAKQKKKSKTKNKQTNKKRISVQRTFLLTNFFNWQFFPFVNIFQNSLKFIDIITSSEREE